MSTIEEDHCAKESFLYLQIEGRIFYFSRLFE